MNIDALHANFCFVIIVDQHIDIFKTKQSSIEFEDFDNQRFHKVNIHAMTMRINLLIDSALHVNDVYALIV